MRRGESSIVAPADAARTRWVPTGLADARARYQRFGPTSRSRMATLSRRATEMFRGPAVRQSTPTSPQAQMNAARISAEEFENKYRGYPCPLTRFTQRHPSDRMRPARKAAG